MKISANAQAILKRIEYATLATVDEDGQPWNAPVYCAYDRDYNFYWGSHEGSQHAKNVRQNGRVFLSIYNSTATPGTGEGVYVQAECIELTKSEDISSALTLIQDRRTPIPYWKREQFQPSGAIRLYKAVPEHVWINSESHINDTYIDTRVSAEEI
jgi:nitroimidazol reductase NimA-like FMN-containing flavoprotein (pyridoxamine 5'-phosphate oxidase superfamily)